tara:strand:+ start:2604 stop:3242 length:639 start_codon:yes stop_codon:yes gene_type:complete
MSVSTNQANAFSQQVQNAKANIKAQNNAVMDSYHQQVQEKRTADYVQGATDTFKDLKAVSGVKDAVAANSAKYLKPTGKILSKGAIGAEAGGKIAGVAGRVSSVLTGATDLYADVKAGGIVGDNWAKKAENIGDVVGGGLDALSMIDPMLAPLSVLGSGAELGAAFAGSVGDGLDAAKSSAHAAADAAQELKATTPEASLAQSGLTDVARTA